MIVHPGVVVCMLQLLPSVKVNIYKTKIVEQIINNGFLLDGLRRGFIVSTNVYIQDNQVFGAQRTKSASYVRQIIG